MEKLNIKNLLIKIKILIHINQKEQILKIMNINQIKINHTFIQIIKQVVQI